MPEDWSIGKPSSMGDGSNQFPKPQIGTPGYQHPEDAGAVSIPPRLSANSAQPESSNPANSSQPTTQGSLQARSSPRPPKAEPPVPTHRQRQWWKNWIIWAGLAGLCSGSIALIAVAALLKLPSAPNCPAIFWPLASGSVRLQCAQIAASKQTVSDLLEAIALVRALPKNHSLRPEADRYLEQWSQDIIALAEEQFQSGNLQEAIGTAKKIPSDNPASASVQQQISKWQSIWSQAESIYRAAEAEIPDQRWYQASMTAVRLLNVGNNYWATTKYEELKNNIETARVDGDKLLKAENLVNRGSFANLKAALRLAESVGSSSYMYKKAQVMIPELGHKMLDLAQAALDRKDADEAITIANQIPAVTDLEMEVQDFITIADAKRNSWVGTVPSIEAAIMTVQRIAADRPLYDRAQELIASWQLEIEDVQHLEKAQELAQSRTIGDLSAAIAEASLIPDSNPRGQEAKQQINRWQEQIETFEDQPIIDRAEQMSQPQDIASLQAAISEAGQIVRGRALYGQAQRKIRTWTRQIQTIEDQPFLDQARELASNGNLPAAISAAQEIQPGRALYREAQAVVRDWQEEIQAEQDWREAQQIAQQGTPEAIEQALRLADRVPVKNPLRADVNFALNSWGQQLLRIAQDRSTYDMPAAIAIADKIPRSSDAYQAAQDRIADWNRILNPPPPPQVEPSPDPNATNLDPNSTNLEPSN